MCRTSVTWPIVCGVILALGGAVLVSNRAWPDLGWLVSPPLLHVSWLAAAGVVGVIVYRERGRGTPRVARAPGATPALSDLAPETGTEPAGQAAGSGNPWPERTTDPIPAAAPRSRITLAEVQAAEAALRARIKGQDEAIQAIVDTLRLAAVGTARTTRKPVATFLLAGATGTGKTEAAKATAKALGRTLVRLDMPHFSSRESAALLVGSGPGFVTGDSAGQLMAAVKGTPDAMVLLDEIEKAHPAVWDPFLRLFDEGVLTDRASGHEVDFTRTVIFLTSNLLQELDPGTPEGEVRRRLIDHGYFRPELVNRLDRIVLFRRLPAEALRGIIRKIILNMVAGFQGRQGLGQLVVQVDRGVVELIESRCELQLGAREAQRQAEMVLGKPLADAFLDAGPAWREAPSLCVGVEDGVVLVRTE